MAWEDVLKMPPVRNPREDEFNRNDNDNLSMKEYVELFEKVVDPIIEEQGHRFAVSIPTSELKMSDKKAAKVAKKLYKDMGYNAIFATDGILYFKLQGEGKV